MANDEGINAAMEWVAAMSKLRSRYPLMPLLTPHSPERQQHYKVIATTSSSTHEVDVQCLFTMELFVQPVLPTHQPAIPSRITSLIRATAFGLTMVGAGLMLKMDVVPGEYESKVDAFSPFCICLVLPAIGVWIVAMVTLTVWEFFKRPRLPLWKRWGLASTVVMVGTFFLLDWHIPRLIGFAFSVNDFERFVATSPPEIERFSEEQNEMTFGRYRVDRYGTDRRGGVYFRTATGPDGIGPDELSFGFVFRPNTIGSPFGNARYRLGHLFGDWYWFCVSDDS